MSKVKQYLCFSKMRFRVNKRSEAVIVLEQNEMLC